MCPSHRHQLEPPDAAMSVGSETTDSQLSSAFRIAFGVAEVTERPAVPGGFIAKSLRSVACKETSDEHR